MARRRGWAIMRNEVKTTFHDNGARRDPTLLAAVDPGEHPGRPLSAGRTERRALPQDSGEVSLDRRGGV